MFCTFLESQVATSTRFPRQILVRTQKFARKMRTVGLVDYSLQCASTRFRAPPHVELLSSVWAGRRTGRTLQLFGCRRRGGLFSPVLLLAWSYCWRLGLRESHVEELHADTRNRPVAKSLPMERSWSPPVTQKARFERKQMLPSLSHSGPMTDRGPPAVTLPGSAHVTSH